MRRALDLEYWGYGLISFIFFCFVGLVYIFYMVFSVDFGDSVIWLEVASFLGNLSRMFILLIGRLVVFYVDYTLVLFGKFLKNIYIWGVRDFDLVGLNMGIF